MAKRGGKREPGPGKKLGRTPKPKIEQRADRGIATTVLSSIDEHEYWRFLLCADQMADPEKQKTITLAERAQIEHTMEYLTNKRDGKPAQGMFVGDTRESARELDFGDLPDLVAPGKSQPAGKPN